jgi:hypothetical protein
MIRQALVAATLLGTVPAHGLAPATGQETRVPRMASFLEWVADGSRGLYIRADSGRWYYARIQGDCPALHPNMTLSFQTAPNGDFDRFSAISAEGWRCQVASVVTSDGPPRPDRR